MSDALITAFNAATTWQEALAAIKKEEFSTILFAGNTGEDYIGKLDDLPEDAGREQAIGNGVNEFRTLFGLFETVEEIEAVVKAQIDVEHAKHLFINGVDAARTPEDIAVALAEHVAIVNQQRQALIADWSAETGNEAVANRVAELKVDQYTIVLKALSDRLGDVEFMAALSAKFAETRADGHIYGVYGLVDALDNAGDAIDAVYAFNSATTSAEILESITTHGDYLLDDASDAEWNTILVSSGRTEAVAKGMLEIKNFFGDFTGEELAEALDLQVSVEYNKYVFIRAIDDARAEDAADVIAATLAQQVTVLNGQRQALITQWEAVEGNAQLAARVAELKADPYTIILKNLAARLDDADAADFLVAITAQFLQARGDSHYYGVYSLLENLDKAADAADPVYAFNNAVTWQDALAAIKGNAEALELDADALTKLDDLPDNAGREQAIALGVLEYKALFGSYADAAGIRTVVEYQIDVEHAKFKFITALDKATTQAEMTAAIKATIALVNTHRQELIAEWSQSNIPAVKARAEALADTAFTKVLAEIVTHIDDVNYMAELGALMLAARNGLPAGQFFGDGKIVTALAASDKAIDVLHDASISGTSTGSLTEDGSQGTVEGVLSVLDEDWGENVFQAVAAADLRKEYGTFSFNEATGVWSFTIDSTAAQSLKKDQVVQQTLTVKSADGTASQTITVTVTGANDAPVAAAAGNDFSGNEDTAITGTLPAGFDADGDALTYELVGEANGLTLNENGSFSYQPAGNVTGTFTFKYRVVDANGAVSEEQSFRITVNPVNDNPDSSEGGNSASGNEDATIIGQVPAGVDVESDALTYELVAPVAGLTFNDDGTFTYIPAADFHGEVTFEYRVVDQNEGKSAARSFVLTVNAVNDAPVAAAAGNSASGNEDTVITGDLPNGTDVDGDALTYELVAPVAGLTLNDDGTFRYVPPADSNGVVTFQYRVVDTAGLASEPQTFELTVNAVNDAPRDILLSNNSVLENTAAGTEIGKLTASDPEGGAFTYTLLDNAGGRFIIDANGSLRVANNYALDYEQAMSHTIRVQVRDSAGATYEETFSIGVTDDTSESVTGTAGADVLVGGAGKDVFNGGLGNDKLAGGLGNDMLSGGRGRDVFVFDSKLGTSSTDRKVNFDKITDFSVRDDSIYLDNAIFTKLGSGTPTSPKQLNKSFFTIGNKANDRNDYIIYNDKTGVLSYDADGSGRGKAIEFAQISKNLAMTNKDFFVI